MPRYVARLNLSMSRGSGILPQCLTCGVLRSFRIRSSGVDTTVDQKIQDTQIAITPTLDRVLRWFRKAKEKRRLWECGRMQYAHKSIDTEQNTAET